MDDCTQVCRNAIWLTGIIFFISGTGLGFIACLWSFAYDRKNKIGAFRDTLSRETVLMPKALTAENGAKAIMIDEFKETLVKRCVNCDGVDGRCYVCQGKGEYIEAVYVQWPTIKAIYAMAVKNLGERL